MYRMNNINNSVPSFLVIFALNLATTKHSSVTNNITSKSTINTGLIGIALIEELMPKMKIIFKTEDPTTLPTIISTLPFLAATREVTNSGNDVPTETIVKPTNFSDKPSDNAIDWALSTTRFPPKIIPVTPITMKMTHIIREIFGFAISVFVRLSKESLMSHPT